MKIFYRVQQDGTDAGLWYNRNGVYNGRIVQDYDWLAASDLPMDFNEEKAGGWLSATDTLEGLFVWFSEDEIIKLQESSIYVYAYHAKEFKWYDPYSHHLIKADSRIVSKLFF